MNKIMNGHNEIRTTLFSKLSLSRIGIFGNLIVLIPMFITVFIYRGPNGQMYNPLNHFISELGFVGVSELAWFFNGGIFFGSLLLAYFMWRLGEIFQNKLIKISCLIGMLTCFFASLVGIFSMNNPEPHIVVAMGFFFSGMLAIILFSIGVYIDKEKIFPKIIAFYGILVFLCFMIFLFNPFDTSALNFTQTFTSANLADLDSIRPSVWNIAILEWISVLSIIIWVFILSFIIKKRQLKDL